MGDRPEIPQDLVREMETLLRHVHANRFVGTLTELEPLLAKLDALEQPPDPAEVAAETYVGHTFTLTPRTELSACGLTPVSCIREHLPDIERQAYAKREKAVKAFWTEHNCLEKNDGCLICLWVRRLHGWDK